MKDVCRRMKKQKNCRACGWNSLTSDRMMVARLEVIYPQLHETNIQLPYSVIRFL